MPSRADLRREPPETYREILLTERCEHPAFLADEPRGYVAWFEWAEKKGETHEQRRCEHCGLFAIWVSRWSDDFFHARDGRTFAIFSEHVRGEPRFYSARRREDGSPRLDGERTPSRAVIGGEDWVLLPVDGSTSKRTVRRRVERYVRETSPKEER